MRLTVKTTLEGKLLEAALHRAAIECMESFRDPGVSMLMKKALRYYLSKQGYENLESRHFIKNRPRIVRLDRGSIQTPEQKEN